MEKFLTILDWAQTNWKICVGAVVAVIVIIILV